MTAWHQVPDIDLARMIEEGDEEAWAERQLRYRRRLPSGCGYTEWREPTSKRDEQNREWEPIEELCGTGVPPVGGNSKPAHSLEGCATCFLLGVAAGLFMAFAAWMLAT